MRRVDDDFLCLSGLTCLLAFAPLIRGGHTVWAGHLMAAVTAGLWIFRVACDLWRGSLSAVWRASDFFIWAAVAWLFFCLARPASPPDASDALLIFLGSAGCFFLARRLSHAGWGMALLLCVSLTGAAAAGIGILQFADLLPHASWRPPQFVASTFVNHNHFASYLVLLFPSSCMVLLLAPLKAVRKFMFVMCTLLMAIGILLSCSRGAWAGLGLSSLIVIGVMGVPGRGGTWSRARTAALLATLLLAGFLISRPPIGSRLATLIDIPGDPSFQMRGMMWQGTWGLLQSHPWLGHGAGSFVFEFPLYRPAGLNRLIDYAHNEYLQLVAEFGLVGLGLLALAVLPVLARIVGTVRRSKTPWKQAAGLGVLMGAGAVALHSLMDFPWHIPSVTYGAAAFVGMMSGVGFRADPSPMKIFRIEIPEAGVPVARWVSAPFLAGGIFFLAQTMTPLIAADQKAVRATALMEARQYDAAIPLLEEAVAKAPYRPAYHRQLGASNLQRAWQVAPSERRAFLKKAVAAYENALALIGADIWSAHGLAQAHKALGNLPQADLWLHRAVRRDPRNPLYWKDRAEVKLLRHEAADAARAFRQAHQLAAPHHFFPALFAHLTDPAFFVERGEAWFAQGAVGLAKTAFRVAQFFDSNHPGAQWGVAIVAWREGRPDEAREIAARLKDPRLRSKWFAWLAHDQWKHGNRSEAQGELDKSLSLDSSNLLAKQLKVLMARTQSETGSADEAVQQLLSLNLSPVFVTSTSASEPLITWEPEEGGYDDGHKTKEGWSLFTNGAIHQHLFLPPGKVRFTVMASGTKAKNLGPTLVLSWSGRPLLSTEVQSETWTAYEVETEIQPGESLLTVHYPNDLNDRFAYQDRNLKIEKVTASWKLT